MTYLFSGSELGVSQVVPMAKAWVGWLQTMDETGWRVGGNSAWQWVATNQHVTVYNVAHGRGFDEATHLVGAHYTGTIVHDGRAPYGRYGYATHQTSLAHLLRRCHDRDTDLPAWAAGAAHQVRDIVHDAQAARDLDEAQRAVVAVDLAERIHLICEQPQIHDECRKLVADLANEHEALFQFLGPARR